MPTPAWLLVLATLLPLASFVVLVFAGRRFGNPFAGIVATAAIGLSFLCSLAFLFVWLSGGTWQGQEWGFDKLPIAVTFPWIPVGQGIAQDHPGFLDLGLYIDSLTVAMFAMVTLVSTLVHIFSIGYMGHDPRFARFFTYLGLFCFSMLGLVIGGTTLQLFVFWELVGLCSYLLIGFWYEKKSASDAAIKAFVTNRVGDFGFLIGFGILFYHLGNATLGQMWLTLSDAGAGGDVALPGGVVFGSTMLTIMGIGLFCGAIGKSAQFPLHVWLPDAMEGPTPVSALIHAATMVAAGVYLVGRIFPILTPDAKLFIAIIGCTTLTMAALIAIAQSDIKKVLAYSTLSQLGYMILAMGLGSWVGGLFHLITHAFFKALLFLGSGSVIHAAHHEQEMTQYGGLVRKLPITAATFGIAVLAIAGVGISVGGHEFGFAGYFSKDLIVANAGAMATLAEQTGRSSWFWALFILPVAIAYVTPFYMMRCWMLTFWGKPRNQHVYDHAHESPLLYVPLVLLAMLSIVGGNLLGVRELLQRAIVESDHYVQALADRNEFYAGRTIAIFDRAWPGEAPGAELPESQSLPAAASAPAPVHPAGAHDPLDAGYHLMHTWVFPSFLVGLGLGLIVYLRGYAVADVLMRVPPVRAIHTWLYRRMYFDELYQSVFISVTMALSRLSGWIDAKLVDGLVNLSATTVRRLSDLVGLHDTYVVDGAVNGLADLAQDLGAAVRAPQTGRIRLYVTILLAAVAVGLAGAVVVALS